MNVTRPRLLFEYHDFKLLPYLPGAKELRHFSMDSKFSTLVQVMAWCRQATSHYLSQCWPRSMSPNGVTRPQWINSKCPSYNSVYNEFEYHDFKLLPYLPGAKELRHFSMDSKFSSVFINVFAIHRTFLFLMVHCGIWNRCIVGFLN